MTTLFGIARHFGLLYATPFPITEVRFDSIALACLKIEVCWSQRNLAARWAAGFPSGQLIAPVSWRENRIRCG